MRTKGGDPTPPRSDHAGREGAGGEYTDATQTRHPLRARILSYVAGDLAIAVGQMMIEFTQMRDLARYSAKDG